MLLSPLMGPIIGAGFGLATFDTAEMRRALLALIAGTLLAVGFCALIVVLSPIQMVTSEIAARTRPNLFDLLVALFSGLAGTYAMIRGRHGAIVGVAIATALMPPLAVMGFGIATANWTVLRGSSLLFFTNLMTIAAAAAALARLYGFATDLSPHQTRLQVTMLVGTLALLSLPLGLSLKKIAWEAFATREAKSAIAETFGPDARVNNLSIDFNTDPPQIDATVLTPRYRTAVEAQIAQSLRERLGETVAVTIEQVRTSNGESASIDLAKSVAAQEQRNASRIAHELALVAGVNPDDVLVDTQSKTAQVHATPLAGADLAAYYELERRVAATETGWTAILVPPPLPLPSIENSADRDGTVALVAWAASRLHLPVRLSGPPEEADAIEQALRAKGVAVERAGGGRLSLQWQLPKRER
jgi:uncharacterized hydrophobic protein (TIGR00271 family)